MDIEINNEEIDLKMKLGENGVAFFVEKISENEEICSDLATSSISPLPDELGIEVATGKIKKEPSKSTLIVRFIHAYTISNHLCLNRIILTAFQQHVQQ